MLGLLMALLHPALDYRGALETLELNDICQPTGAGRELFPASRLCFVFLEPADFPHQTSVIPALIKAKKKRRQHKRSVSAISVLVSGGDVREYTTRSLHNHLLFSWYYQIPYIYDSGQAFRHHYPETKMQWLKIRLILDLLHTPSIPENGWLVWIDDDMVLNDQEGQLSMLEKYVQTFAGTASVLITSDTDLNSNDSYAGRFNSGLMLIKKNARSRRMFLDWWNYRYEASEELQARSDFPPTQYTMELLLKRVDFEKGGVLKIVPQRAGEMNLNTFRFEEGYWRDNSVDGRAKQGDSAIQHPGLREPQKSRCVHESLDNAVIPDAKICPSWLVNSCGYTTQSKMLSTRGELQILIDECLDKQTTEL